jgi:Spy/CpxP family protein refolding chaperone
MKALRILILAVALGAGVPAAFAQQGTQPGQTGETSDKAGFEGMPGRGGRVSDQQREEVRKRIESVRIYRLTQELKLDEASAAKLAALLGSLESQRFNLMNKERETILSLREQFAPSRKPDEKNLKTLLEKLEKSRHAMTELRDKEWNGLKGILTIEQQARYVLFQRKFMREMRGMMAGAQGGRGMGSGRGGMGPGLAPGGPGDPADSR